VDVVPRPAERGGIRRTLGAQSNTRSIGCGGCTAGEDRPEAGRLDAQEAL
jgi:hypothetical protein